ANGLLVDVDRPCAGRGYLQVERAWVREVGSVRGTLFTFGGDPSILEVGRVVGRVEHIDEQAAATATVAVEGPCDAPRARRVEGLCRLRAHPRRPEQHGLVRLTGWDAARGQYQGHGEEQLGEPAYRRAHPDRSTARRGARGRRRTRRR